MHKENRFCIIKRNELCEKQEDDSAKTEVFMKVNIYYGGRGVLDDPTLYVIKKMENVLVELRVEVHRYNIY